MNKKIIVIALSVICLSVWSLCIIQLVQKSPSYTFQTATSRASGIIELGDPSLFQITSPPPEINKDTILEPSEKVDAEQAHKIRIDGLSKDNMVEISENKTMSIDALLYALDIRL